MNKILVVGLMVAGTLNFAHAAEPTRGEILTGFLKSLSAEWSGKGHVARLDNNGNRDEHAYDIGTTIEDQGNGDFSVATQTTRDDGLTSSNTIVLSVRGDLLFVTDQGYRFPVQVTDATPTALTYKLQRADYAGQVYVITAHAELNAGHLRGANTVELNSVAIVDDRYEAVK